MMMMASFAIIFAFLHHTIQAKSKFRSLCFMDLPKVQSEMEFGTNSVLNLNSLAVYYRTAITITKAQLLVATGPAAAIALLRLQQLQMQQTQLGLKQKQLIRLFETQLGIRLSQLTLKSRSHLSRNNTKWQEFVITRDVLTISPMNYRLPIEPDEPSSPAPVYRMKPNLGFATRLTANWNSFVFANSENQKLQEQNTQWGFECTVEQRKTKEYGPPLIKVDLMTVVKADKL